MKINIKEILFWIFLFISMILLIWNVLGNSPAEFIALTSFIFTVLIKVMSISERMIKLEMRFNTLARDFKEHINESKKEIKNG